MLVLLVLFASWSAVPQALAGLDDFVGNVSGLKRGWDVAREGVASIAHDDVVLRRFGSSSIAAVFGG